jgi:glycine betaine/proline transport system permease protein
VKPVPASSSGASRTGGSSTRDASSGDANSGDSSSGDSSSGGPSRTVAQLLASRQGRTARKVFLIVAVIAGLFATRNLGHEVPAWLDAKVRGWGDRTYQWTIIHRETSPLFRFVFNPISTALKNLNNATLWLLRSLRWTGVLATVALIARRVGGWRPAVIATGSLLLCGVLGVWDLTLIALALMLVSVGLAMVIGVPLGVWAGLNDRVDRVLSAVLDTAQVLPAYVYLLPVVVAVGIGAPAAIVTTVIFAIPPAVKLTSLGIRAVPVVSTEVGQSFGCTRRQLLAKVQLPMAKRPILLGLNQVIMMAFGIVVIAAQVGTGGLGDAVQEGLQKVDVGRALAPGLALVFAAVALDRMSTSERSKRVGSRFFKTSAAMPARLKTLSARITILPGWILGLASVVGIVGLAFVTRTLRWSAFPSWLHIDVVKPANSAVKWINTNLREGVPFVGGTGPFSDFLVLKLLTPLRDLLLAPAWWAIAGVTGLVAWRSGGRRRGSWKLGLLCTGLMVGIASLRVWDLAMDTLSQVLVALAISVTLAVPLGILVGRSDRIERFARPFLDAAQVLPPFVYLVPVIFLFNVGRVPGVIASVIYALPPGIRLTSMGLRSVPWAPREAAISFGATPKQELLRVQLPLAARSILLGINQTMLMVLSMVVIAALVGAGALGLEAVVGVRKQEIGRGLAGGLAIVGLAIVLDRITQAWGNRSGGPSTAR